MHLHRFIKNAVFCMVFVLLMNMGSVILKADTTTDAEEDTTTEVVTTEEETEATSTTEEKTTTEKTTADRKTSSPSTEKKQKKKVKRKTTAKKKASKKKSKKKSSKKAIQPSKVADLDKMKEKDSDKRTTGSTSSKIIPKVYNDHGLEMKKKKEMIGGFIYFNQADAAWNDNGYHIKQAGCGPTSMAVVISSLTDQWVTPVDATVWAYEHGYYSNSGSSHSLIPALAKEYDLDCEGVGRDTSKIRKALRAGNPVVCLMGPGYFTKGGHFMVLVDIDKDDNVTVADVGSRQRSQYKYKLKDVIDQSKSASAGGPFWVISDPDKENPKASKDKDAKKEKKTELSYRIMKNASSDTVEKTVQSGIPVMMMTDKQVMKDQEFVYITVIDKNQLATVTDVDFKKKEQYPFSELLGHTRSDLTGISFWKVSGVHGFLMPLAQDQ